MEYYSPDDQINFSLSSDEGFHPLIELEVCPSPNHLGICGRRVLSFLMGGSFTILTDFSFFLIENSAPRRVRPNRPSKPLQ